MLSLYMVFLCVLWLGIVSSTDPWETARCPTGPEPEEIRKVTNNVYVAIGYALGNSVMVIAPRGLIIIDTTETINASSRILKEFRKISSKPIKAIVYTHYHQDHINGAKSFIEDPSNPPDIWSDAKLVSTNEQFQTYAAMVRTARGIRQIGAFVPDSIFKFGAGNQGFVPPNRFVNSPIQKETIAGLKVEFMQIPGETSDMIGMWVPEWKVFFSGDDIYKAFPNLYSLRGSLMRDPKYWYRSVQKIIDLKPRYMVGSHRLPLVGRDKIRNTLTYYRDAIQFVHDQSLRYLNKGYFPDEVAEMVSLPDTLASQPYLQQCYGMVDTASKGVFQLYLGWFSGDPSDMFPLSRSEKAERMMTLVGGYSNLLAQAKQAILSGDFRWALELSTYALKLDKNNKIARDLKVRALSSLGDVATFPVAEYYYKTTALEVKGTVKLDFPPARIHRYIYSFRMRQLFEIMPGLFKAESCRRTGVFAFVFKDTGLKVYFRFRNGIAILTDDKPEEGNVFKINFSDESLFRDLVIKMMDGTGWPLSRMSGVTFSAEYGTTRESNFEKFKAIFFCFDWDVTQKSW